MITLFSVVTQKDRLQGIAMQKPPLCSGRRDLKIISEPSLFSLVLWCLVGFFSPTAAYSKLLIIAMAVLRFLSH